MQLKIKKLAAEGLASLAEWWVKAVRDEDWGGAVVGGRGLAPLAEWWVKVLEASPRWGRGVGGRGLDHREVPGEKV